MSRKVSEIGHLWAAIYCKSVLALGGLLRGHLPQLLLSRMAPSPVWMVSGCPPPFILPRICELLKVPSTVTGIPKLMWPSPVLASMFVWKSDGSTRSTLPSPVRIVQLDD